MIIKSLPRVALIFSLQDGGGNAPDGREDGGGGGQGDEGEGGEWRPDMSGGEGKGEGQGNDTRRRPDAPNPFR